MSDLLPHEERGNNRYRPKLLERQATTDLYHYQVSGPVRVFLKLYGNANARKPEYAEPDLKGTDGQLLHYNANDSLFDAWGRTGHP